MYNGLQIRQITKSTNLTLMTSVKLYPNTFPTSTDILWLVITPVYGSKIPEDCHNNRPKLGPEGSKFQDFIIRIEDGFPGFVNLLGIESPGLTSALAIA